MVGGTRTTGPRGLAAGRPWAAWKSLRGYVKDPADAPEQVVVLAARAVQIGRVRLALLPDLPLTAGGADTQQPQPAVPPAPVAIPAGGTGGQSGTGPASAGPGRLFWPTVLKR